ncbi:hypothetical protein [Edaphobacter sp. DSM 109919]|uniref:Uncharacterized protein n=1 Tax=Edaphobacter paludis TaxID=3035702 RepID=A0AAU7CWN2_9BACT
MRFYMLISILSILLQGGLEIGLSQTVESFQHLSAPNKNDGIANAINFACAGVGCRVIVDTNYTLSEFPGYFSGNLDSSYIGLGTRNPPGTQIFDYRAGRSGHIFNDPYLQNPFGAEFLGEYTTDIRTKQGVPSPSRPAGYLTRSILQENLGDGSNDAMLGKTTATALGVFQYNYEQGQHITQQVINYTHGIGDTLAETLRSQSNGGYRNAFDEGTHLHDTYALQDANVYEGNCAVSCVPGSRAIGVDPTNAPGTQGNGRILYDTDPVDALSFPVSSITDAQTGSALQMINSDFSSEFTRITPDRQTFPISHSTVLTSSVEPTTFNAASRYDLSVKDTSRFSTGLACLADEKHSAYSTFEWIDIKSITNSRHLIATLKYAHPSNSVLTQGGWCGRVFSMDIDTYRAKVPKPLRRIFPVMGSLDGSTLWVFSGASLQNAMATSFLNLSLTPASLVRASNQVTLDLPNNAPLDFDPIGLTVKIAKASDPSFDGVFTVIGAETTGPGRWTKLKWNQLGSNSVAERETANLQTNNNKANIYYGAEVYSVQGSSKDTTDNHFELSPNTVPFALGLSLEEAEWMQQRVSEGFNFQTVYFPDVIDNDPVFGYSVSGVMNDDRVGYSINNATPEWEYAGHGGSFRPPKSFLYNSGLWSSWMAARYAPEKAVIELPCKLSGCKGKDAAIGLVLTPNNGPNVQYDPDSSTWSWWVAGESIPVFEICCGAGNAKDSHILSNYPIQAKAGVNFGTDHNGSKTTTGDLRYDRASAHFVGFNGKLEQLAYVSDLPARSDAITADIGGSLIPAQGCQDMKVQVKKATTSTIAVVSPAGSLSAGWSSLDWGSTYVYPNGTVNVHVCNPTSASITPSVMKFNLRVLPE